MKLFGRKLDLRDFHNLKLRTKIVIVVNTLLLFFLFLFGLYFYESEKNRIISLTDEVMYKNVADLVGALHVINPDESGVEQIVVNTVDEALAGISFSQKRDSLVIPKSRLEVLDKIKLKLNNDYKNIFLNDARKMFSNITYYNSGYPFIVSKSGEALVHPALEGDDFSESVFFNKMISEGKITGKIKYIWPESNFGDEKVLYYQFYEPLDAYVAASFHENTIFDELQTLKLEIALVILFISILFSVAIWYFVKPIVGKINLLVGSINTLANGMLIRKFEDPGKDEVGEIMKSVNRLTDNLKKNADFANQVGSGKLDTDFEIESEDDVLGNSLLEMRKSLKATKEEEEKRKTEEEKQNWSSRGLAKFNDILRSNDNLSVLGDRLTSEMTDYLEANQCGLFVINEDTKNEIELVSAYAFSRKKFVTKKVAVGEGVVGTCVKEGKTIYLKDVPEDYIEITSGLGQATPRELLVVPLRNEGKILGVLEIASFKPFQKHEIEFVEQVAETITSSVSNVMVNENTNKLLEQARQQAEQLAAQEEEMRQTMEELTTTQEEMQRKNKQMEDLNHRFQENESALKQQITEARKNEESLKQEINEKNKLIQALESQLNKR